MFNNTTLFLCFVLVILVILISGGLITITIIMVIMIVIIKRQRRREPANTSGTEIPLQDITISSVSSSVLPDDSYDRETSFTLSDGAEEETTIMEVTPEEESPIAYRTRSHDSSV